MRPSLRRRTRRIQVWIDDHGWPIALALAAGAILVGVALLIASM